jgi:hypothetical protein
LKTWLVGTMILSVLSTGQVQVRESEGLDQEPELCMSKRGLTPENWGNEPRPTFIPDHPLSRVRSVLKTWAAFGGTIGTFFGTAVAERLPDEILLGIAEWSLEPADCELYFRAATGPDGAALRAWLREHLPVVMVDNSRPYIGLSAQGICLGLDVGVYICEALVLVPGDWAALILQKIRQKSRPLVLTTVASAGSVSINLAATFVIPRAGAYTIQVISSAYPSFDSPAPWTGALMWSSR